MISPSRMAQVPFILYGIITAYKAQLAISDSCARARRVTKCQVRNIPQFWKIGVILPLTRIQEKNLVGRVYMHRNRYYADPLSLSFLEPQKTTSWTIIISPRSTARLANLSSNPPSTPFSLSVGLSGGHPTSVWWTIIPALSCHLVHL